MISPSSPQSCFLACEMKTSLRFVVSASNSEIKDLEAGAHDPQRRGFTLQQAELSFTGAVDPYLTAEVHGVFAEPGLAELNADRLRDESAIKKARAFPYQLLAAYLRQSAI